MPNMTIRSGGSPEISFPRRRTWPRAGRVRPEMVRSVVVLPAPLLPIKVTISPWSIVRLSWCSACTRP